MRVEQDGLDLREQRVVLVDVAPACLNHPDLSIGRKMWQRALQEIFRRNEIGVEDGDELAAGLRESRFQRARLVSFSVNAVHVADVESAQRVPPYGKLGD